MRGFTRRRPWQGRGGSMDERWLQRALEALPVEAASAQRRALPGVPDSFALIASAPAADASADGARWIVAASDRSGGDAVLAALAAAAAEPSPPAMLAACAPHWDGASRWLLSRLGASSAPASSSAGALAAASASSSAGAPAAVAAPASSAPAPAAVGASGAFPGIWPLCLPGEQGAALARAESVPFPPLPPERLADGLAEPARALFQRTALAMAGLAAKYEGATRSAPRAALELVLLAQPQAALWAESGEVVLELAGRRIPLRGAGLADAMDRLEAQLRKRAGDRRTRKGGDGARARLLAALAEAAGLRHLRRWPVAGDGAALDGLGVRPDGEAALLAARERLDLPELAAILRGVWAAAPALPLMLQHLPASLRLDSGPALLLAAQTWEESARAVLQRLSPVAAPVALWQAGGPEGPLAPFPLHEAGAQQSEAAADADPALAERERNLGAPRPRRRRSRGRRGAAPDPGAESAAPSAAAAQPAPQPSPGAAAQDGPVAPGGPAQGAGFDEVSLFDLDTDAGDEARPSRRRRSGRRSHRPGDSPRGDSAAADSSAGAGAEGRGERERGGRGRSTRRRGRGRGRAAGARATGAGDSADSAASADSGESGDSGEAQSAGEDSLDEVMQLSPDAPEILDPGDYERLSALGEEAEDAGGEDAGDAEDGEDADAGDADSEVERMRSERARRRSARAEAGGGDLPGAGDESAPGAASELPRGRAAILAHADRQSIIAAVLLAREVRQLEGIWIYPQAELMTFFRSVATDLPGRMPIYVVGFAAKPAREALQAAALYRGRLAWFDHHAWPPEDIEAMRQAIGAPLAHLHPDTHSSLPAALAFCTWRSRLSSKLVDLVTGAFTQHDFEKWGRLWWWRLGEMVRQPGGPRRADLEPLINGRPSDLTEAAERAPAPPLPEEAAWAAQRDFRLVHFAGLLMLVAEVPAGLDLHMAMRIARAPHGARVSLARTAGEEIFVLAADEPAGQGRVDTAAMALHLSQKFAWLEALPDADRVTRFRARGVVEQPGRLEELIAEIGMGRAILEG